MAEYDLGELRQPARASVSGRAVRVQVTAGVTLAHLSAVALHGAGAFRVLAAANGVIDPVPYAGPPPRAVRRVSVMVGDSLLLPDTGGL